MFSQWLLKQVTSERCAKRLREYRWKDGVRGVSKKWLKYDVASIEFFYNLKQATGSSLVVLFQAIC